MPGPPLTSVVIGVYDVAEYLRKAWTSAVARPASKPNPPPFAVLTTRGTDLARGSYSASSGIRRAVTEGDLDLAAAADGEQA